MKTAKELSSIFKTRGPLDPGADAAVCVPRPELGLLLRAVQARTVDAYLAVLGSKQIGKTTLLYQLRARLRPSSLGVALIDLSPLRDQSEADFYRYMASQINSELEPTFLRGPRRRVGVSLPTNPVQFRTFLLDTARQSQSPRLVLLLDQVEALTEKQADPFFGTIRNVFSSRRKEDEAAFGKYLFVLCGSKEPHRLSSGSHSPFNVAEPIYLHDLALEGVWTIISNFSRVAIVAPSATAQWIYEQTCGHPYLTQRLCAQIEEWHPGVITREIVQRATVQLLRGDDHIARTLHQIDADPAARNVLQQVLAGKSVSFSRMQPGISRLELLGAIRDEGQCVIRNPIYYAAMRSHYYATPRTTGKAKQRLTRLLVFLIALAFLVLNLPFMYNYAADIYLTTRSVNEKFLAAKTLGGDFTIHYDRVLHANSTETTDITVDLDGPLAAGPIILTLQPDQADVTLEGAARRTLDQPYQQVRFRFMLNQNGLRVLRYNPLNPSTDHRRVALNFELPNDKTRKATYLADFVVDYWSDFIFSAVVSLASFVGAIGAIFGNAGIAKRVIRGVARLLNLSN